MLDILQFLGNPIRLTAPLFILIILGFCLIRYGKWDTSIASGLTRFVFSVALPAMLFRMMSHFSEQPSVDARLLLAFFGGCLIVFAIGRLIAAYFFKFDGTSGSVFALGGIFSNNVMLGIPVTTAILGDAALPSVALVIVFNGLILWTLVTVSVEWSQHGSLTVNGLSKMIKNVLKNPLIIGIISGTLFSLTKYPLPIIVDEPIRMLSQIAAPMSLIALGMGLAEYHIRDGWRISVSICALKLIVLPIVVWGLAVCLKLPIMETKVVVLLSSMAVGVNVYLMSRQFNVLIGPAASSLIVSTIFSAITTPLILTLIPMVKMG